MGWESEITVWEPPRRFVDCQRRGPYRRWIHEHCFEAADGGTRVLDRVDYLPPGGWLSNRLFIARDIRAIFAYRAAALGRRFPG
jgi:ligand-binding SRPBCC domain-containing protein